MTAPTLDTYTDTATMRTLLQARLPGFAEGRLRIDSLGVHSVRRNTSRERSPCPMTLCYELQVSDAAGDRSGTQLLYAQVYRNGLAAPAFARHDRSRLAAPAFGEALAHLPGLDLLLWALPNDPGVPQLAALLDPERAARAMPGGVMACGATAVDSVELLRYAPQCRATLRYALAATDGAGPRPIYAKTFCDDRAAAIHRRFAWFWELSQSDPQAPLVAQPLGHDPAMRTLWQAGAPGVPLAAALAAGDGAALMGRLARALALLHAAPQEAAAGAAPRTVGHWVAEARRRQRKIGRADAALAGRAARVADAIEAHAAGLAGRPLTLIHGDFHPQQVWVHRGRVVLFDFDEFTLGDPMEDLAEFVLKLDPPGSAPALGPALVDAYAAAAPRLFDRRCLAWHLTVQALLQASRAFVYQQPGWAGELGRRLDASAARAAALATPDAP